MIFLLNLDFQESGFLKMRELLMVSKLNFTYLWKKFKDVTREVNDEGKVVEFDLLITKSAIAGICMEFFLSKFLPENHLPIIPFKGKLIQSLKFIQILRI